MTTRNWLILMAVVVFVIVIWASWVKGPPSTIISDFLNDWLKEEILAKDREIAKMDAMILELRGKLSASEEIAKAWAKKYADLQKERDSVQAPKTDKELRERFTALGFPPVPDCGCGGGYICFRTGYSQ